MTKNSFPNKATQFSKDNQPSPQAKREGWEKKQGREAIKDAFIKFSSMPMPELAKIIENINNKNYKDLDGNDLTAAEVHAIRHATDKKYTVDYINRGVEYAPRYIEHSGELKFKEIDLKDDEDFVEFQKWKNRKNK